MDNISNIIKTVLPVSIGLGMLWYILRKESNKTGTRNKKLQGLEEANTTVEKSAQEPNNLQDKSDSADGNICLPNATVTGSNDNGNLREHDIEEDSGPCNNQGVEENVVPATPIVSDPPYIEKHDALLLYAKEDRLLVKHLKQVLVSNLGTDIDDLNIVLYEEFAPEVQSYFKTTGQVFHRCRYLFVVVTSNFREDSLMMYQHEIALMDSIRNPSNKERVIPVWAEEGSQNSLPELSVLRGIDYERNQVDFQKFKITFQYGRRKIHL